MADSAFNIEKFPTSESAIRMLSRVSPVYNNSYLMKWFMQVMGLEMDDLWQRVYELREQCFVATTTWGIDYWEDEYSLDHPKDMTIEERRARIKRMRLPKYPLNPTRMSRTIEEVYGISTVIDETVGYGRFTIRANKNNQSMDTLYDMLDWVVDIKPSHLTIDFVNVVSIDFDHYVGAVSMLNKKFTITPKVVEDTDIITNKYLGLIPETMRKVSIIPRGIDDVDIPVREYFGGGIDQSRSVTVIPRAIEDSLIKVELYSGSSGSNSRSTTVIPRAVENTKVDASVNIGGGAGGSLKTTVIPRAVENSTITVEINGASTTTLNKGISVMPRIVQPITVVTTNVTRLNGNIKTMANIDRHKKVEIAPVDDTRLVLTAEGENGTYRRIIINPSSDTVTTYDGNEKGIENIKNLIIQKEE